jgi:hypothetical protein
VTLLERVNKITKAHTFKACVNLRCPFTWIALITFVFLLPLFLTTNYCQLVAPNYRDEHKYLFTLSADGSAEHFQFQRAGILSQKYFYVGGHGVGNPKQGIVGIMDKRGSNVTVVDEKELAKLIINEKKSRGIPEDLPVFLLSCNSGAGKRSYAQNLSDLLNVEVVAPNEWLVIDHYGFVRTGQNKISAYFSFGRLSLERFTPN